MPDTAVPTPGEPVVGERRCGRCLQQFADAAWHDQALPGDWWLCDACRESLITGNRGEGHVPARER